MINNRFYAIQLFALLLFSQVVSAEIPPNAQDNAATPSRYVSPRSISEDVAKNSPSASNIKGVLKEGTDSIFTPASCAFNLFDYIGAVDATEFWNPDLYEYEAEVKEDPDYTGSKVGLVVEGIFHPNWRLKLELDPYDYSIIGLPETQIMATDLWDSYSNPRWEQVTGTVNTCAKKLLFDIGSMCVDEGCFGEMPISYTTTRKKAAKISSISDIHGTGTASPLLGQNVNVRGAVTGVFPEGFYIRDDDGPRSGIYIYDPGGDQPLLGDTVSLTAVVEEYYNFTELKTVSNFFIVSNDNPIPVPVELSTGDIGEDWEGCLVRITDAVCTNTNLGYGEWEVNDGSGTLVVNDLGVPYSPELNQIYGITGLVEYSFNFFKVNPRTLSDIEIMAPNYFTKEAYPVEIGENSLVLSWETNTPVATELFWGVDLDQMTPLVENGEVTESHQILLENLQPASFYYIMPFFVDEDDTIKMPVKIFATASESSGEIRVSFNRTLNHINESDDPELFSSHLADSMIGYINIATETLDLALYDFTNHSTQSDTRNAAIVEAVNAAYLRGVKVRLITDANVANDILDGLIMSEIPVLEASHSGIMHQKFIVADYLSIENSWVVTGSTNPNYNNLALDYNNFIAIQDQSLAKAYHNEFNEMWGGSSLIPDLIKSRFSADKIDNTPHYFSVDGKRIELYFSPSDHTTSRITEIIESAVTSVDFAMMAFTEDVIGNSIVNVSKNQIEVKGIIDYVEYSGSEYNKLLNAGIKVYDYANSDGTSWPDAATLHHKFAIVDAGTETGTVITGSHNWTASAESKNDENTLIIHDQGISLLFLKEVERIEKQIFKNLAPICVKDFLQSESASQYNYDILSNDIFNTTIILEITDSSKFGSLKIENDKSITYTPYQPEILQIDSFSYRLSLVNNPFVADTGIAIIENTYPVSVASQSKTDEIVKLYPNPAGDYINLYYEGETNPEWVQLLDITGKVVFETKDITNGYPLRIKSQNFNSGIYLMKIHLGDKIISRKIVRK